MIQDNSKITWELKDGSKATFCLHKIM